MPNKTRDYCADIVRQHDPDRYLLSFFAPPARRPALWALFAFNYEIAKTREIVTETQLGLIRLQWWREALGEIYAGKAPREHAVIAPLADAIQRYDLPQDLFETLIYAREFDLEDTLPSNLEGLLNYCDFTSAPLMHLALKIAGQDHEAEPVRQVAVNYALAGVLRSVPYFARARRCLLPEDLLKAHGQSVNKLYEYKRVENFPRIIEAVAAAHVTGLKPQGGLLKAAQALALIYFRQMKASGYDVFAPRMALEPPFKALRVLLRAM